MMLLDLFCGAGGCARGYVEAGFEVVGVDIKTQPRYLLSGASEFHQADALEFCEKHGKEFDAIHASPPCQAFTSARVIQGLRHPDLLTPTRDLLEVVGRPWVIENVPGAPMRVDIQLCGSQFGEPRLKRHRWFEFSHPPAHLLPSCSHHDGKIISVFGHGGRIYNGVAEWREVMGIDWMNQEELAQAIPPAYTRFVGERLMEHLLQDGRSGEVSR